MSVQKHEPQWWSDIFQTEMRLPQKRYRRLCILPTYCVATGSNRSRIARKFIKTFLVKVRRFFSHRPPTTSAFRVQIHSRHICMPAWQLRFFATFRRRSMDCRFPMMKQISSRVSPTRTTKCERSTSCQIPSSRCLAPECAFITPHAHTPTVPTRQRNAFNFLKNTHRRSVIFYLGGTSCGLVGCYIL